MYYQQETICDTCSGYGHTAAVCPSMCMLFISLPSSLFWYLLPLIILYTQALRQTHLLHHLLRRLSNNPRIRLPRSMVTISMHPTTISSTSRLRSHNSLNCTYYRSTRPPLTRRRLTRTNSRSTRPPLIRNIRSQLIRTIPSSLIIVYIQALRKNRFQPHLLLRRRTDNPRMPPRPMVIM